MDTKSGRADVRGFGMIVVVALMTLVAAAGGFLLARPGPGPIEQPVRFNHAIHAQFNSTCDVCHRSYQSRAVAGHPGVEICRECHDPGDDPIGNSAEEAKLRELMGSGKGVAWVRVCGLPGDVHFSHAIHVVKGEVKCAECHGSIGESATPRERPQVFSMDACISCHESRGATVDCLACHR